jgi:hypothetical protein
VSRTGVYLYGETDPQRFNSIKNTQLSIYFTKKYPRATDSLHAEFENNLNLTLSGLIINHPVYLVNLPKR